MNSKTLIINNNEQQYCKGCERNFPPSSFTTNGKSYRTCNTCRIQNRKVYQQKIMPEVDQMVIEFPDFNDFMADLFEEGNENKENIEFKLSCIIKIITLEAASNLKEWVERIVKVISNVDEYSWM